MNAVDAGRVERGEDWEWSSARYHLGYVRKFGNLAPENSSPPFVSKPPPEIKESHVAGRLFCGLTSWGGFGKLRSDVTTNTEHSYAYGIKRGQSAVLQGD